MRKPKIIFSRPLLLTALGLVAVAGCATTPELDAPRAVGPKELTNHDLQAKYAHEFWKRYHLPDMTPYNYKKVVISEFSVEFVTRKIEDNKTHTMEYSSYVMSRVPN